MVNIRTIENIKLGSKITLYNGIYAVIIGFFYLFFTEFIIKVNFRAIDSIYQLFDKYNPEISALFTKILVLQGILIITLGACIIYLSAYIIKKKDKVAWAILFPIGLIFWGGLLAVEILNKNVYTIVFSLIGWVSFIIGMVLPYKYYLRKSYEEY